MADRKISDLTALTTPATGDLIPIVDISEAAAADKNKSITVGELLRGAPDGTAAAPGFAFESDGGNGIFLAGTDQVGIATNGVERVEFGTTEVVFNDGGADVDFRIEGDTNANLLFVDAGNNRIGLGTSSPDALLHLSSATGSASPTPTELRIATTTDASDWSTTDPWGRISFYAADTSGSGPKVHASIDTIAANTPLVSSSLAFRTTRTDDTLAISAVIDNAGNVGIGTTSPAALLSCDLKATGTIAQFRGADSDLLNIDGDSDQITFDARNVSALAFEMQGSEKARIDNSGRLLVGTSTAPTAGDGQYGKLVVQGYIGGNTGAGYMAIARGQAATQPFTNTTEIGRLAFTDSTGNSFAYISSRADGDTGASDYPGRLVFSTTADGASSPTERVRIDSTGKVRFFNGATEYGSIEKAPSSDRLVVNSQNVAGYLAVAGTDYFYWNTTSLGPISDNVYDLGNASQRYSTVYAGTGTINTSDATLKQDIDALDAAELTVATAIKGLIKKFRFIDAVTTKGDDARIHVGVIAQEVEQAFVSAGLDPRRYGLFCEDELEDGTKRLGIRYDELLAFLIAAL